MTKPYTIEELITFVTADFKASGLELGGFLKRFKENHCYEVHLYWKRCSVCKEEIKDDYCIQISLTAARVTKAETEEGNEVSMRVYLVGEDGAERQVALSEPHVFHEECLDNMVRGEFKPIQQVLDYIHMEQEFSDTSYEKIKERHRLPPFSDRCKCYGCEKPIIDGRFVVFEILREDGKNEVRRYYVDYSECITTLPPGTLSSEYYYFHEKCFDELVLDPLRDK